MSEWIKNQIITKFSFLKEYGFFCKLLSLKEDTDRSPYRTMVFLISRGTECFAITVYDPYLYFEPPKFYKLKSEDEVNTVMLYNSENEIKVFNQDEDLWKKAQLRIQKRSRGERYIDNQDVLDVVVESIKRQIAMNKSFYGISIES